MGEFCPACGTRYVEIKSCEMLALIFVASCSATSGMHPVLRSHLEAVHDRFRSAVEQQLGCRGREQASNIRGTVKSHELDLMIVVTWTLVSRQEWFCLKRTRRSMTPWSHS